MRSILNINNKTLLVEPIDKANLSNDQIIQLITVADNEEILLYINKEDIVESKSVGNKFELRMNKLKINDKVFNRPFIILNNNIIDKVHETDQLMNFLTASQTNTPYDKYERLNKLSKSNIIAYTIYKNKLIETIFDDTVYSQKTYDLKTSNHYKLLNPKTI